MTASRATALICLLSLAPGLAAGQSPDPAAERARLGNQRIQAEAERRVREERELQNRASGFAAEQVGASPQPAGTPATDQRAEPARLEPRSPAPAPRSTEAGSPLPDAAADDEPTTRALRQLRELGELKDAGYVTDEEFRRIKQRILERQF